MTLQPDARSLRDELAEAHAGHYFGAWNGPHPAPGERAAFWQRAKEYALQHEGVMGLDDIPYTGGEGLHTLIRVTSDIHQGHADPNELKAWDGLFDKGMVSNKPFVVYRAGQPLGALDPGAKFRDPGYSWTTNERTEALTYVKSRGSTRDLMRITVKPGTKFIDLGDPSKPIWQHGEESDDAGFSYTVLPRGLEWTVENKRAVTLPDGETRVTMWDLSVG